MQQQMGVDQPDYGHLLTGMFHLEHLPIDAGAFLQPRIEPETRSARSASTSNPGTSSCPGR